jgi:glycosyltransferase involved in cell wall biosynthesis
MVLGGEDEEMRDGENQITLLHITAIPLSLGLLRDQVDMLRGRNDFDVQMLCAAGDELGNQLDEYGKTHRVATHAIAISRSIRPWQDLKTVFALRWVFRRLRPQIVVGHFSKAGLLGMIAGRLAGVPVCIYHNYGMAIFSTGGWRKRFLRLGERLTCRLAHRVLCVSHSVREKIIAEGVCPPGKIKTLLLGSHAGVDAQRRFNPNQFDAASKESLRASHGIPAEATVVGFAGRILSLKGVPELVTAWQTLRTEFPNAHLLLVGGHDPRDPVPEAIERLIRTDARIHVTGWIRQVAPFYSIMDVFVLPSHYEGLPTVSLEASSMGLPVVTTRVPGNVDAVEDGVTGTIVPVREPVAMGAAIRRYLNEPDLRSRHGWAGRERMLRDFDPQPILQATLEEYVNLLQEKGVPLPESLRCISRDGRPASLIGDVCH